MRLEYRPRNQYLPVTQLRFLQPAHSLSLIRHQQMLDRKPQNAVHQGF